MINVAAVMTSGVLGFIIGAYAVIYLLGMEEEERQDYEWKTTKRTFWDLLQITYQQYNRQKHSMGNMEKI